MIELKNILKGVEIISLEGRNNIIINGISDNSSKVDKGFLFFAGSLVRWTVLKPREFLVALIYTALIHGITLVGITNSINGGGFIFTVGVVGPLLLAIYKGLPLDCLDYKSAIQKEFGP